MFDGLRVEIEREVLMRQAKDYLTAGNLARRTELVGLHLRAPCYNGGVVGHEARVCPISPMSTTVLNLDEKLPIKTHP